MDNPLAATYKATLEKRNMARTAKKDSDSAKRAMSSIPRSERRDRGQALEQALHNKNK